MTSYERVTFRPEGERARSVFLEDPAVRGSGLLGEVLTGLEVNREGESIIQAGDRRRIISTALVLERVPMILDRTYCELVPADG